MIRDLAELVAITLFIATVLCWAAIVQVPL
jgi:hypothetical protein